MKRPIVGALVLALLTPACLGGGGPQERTVLVDFSSDEFASMMIDYFPSHVTVAQGDTVIFRQTWTGEPHTVTGGTLANKMMVKGGPWLRFFDAYEALLHSGDGLPDPENPTGSAAGLFKAVAKAKDRKQAKELLAGYDALVKAGVPLPDRHHLGHLPFADLVKTVDDESNKFFENTGLPSAWDEEGLPSEESDPVTQNGGQPCYLTKGTPPKDRNKHCTDAQQRQPVFTGKQSYYNSGIIPYQGPQGNTVKVKLADDIKPGNYFFYCSVHGPGQSTEVKVLAKGSKIPSEEDVSREARKEIAVYLEPEEKAFHDAQDGKIDLEGKIVRAPFAGVQAPVFGSIDEFIPRTITTKVGRKVTWTMMGWPHTISFDVPKYFPIIKFAKNGKVSLNPQLTKPAGGSPNLPKEDAPPGQIVHIDGGTYDGKGFFSSALIGGETYAQYTLRFSRPGTYQYACLLHPAMVAKVKVTR